MGSVKVYKQLLRFYGLFHAVQIEAQVFCISASLIQALQTSIFYDTGAHIINCFSYDQAEVSRSVSHSQIQSWHGGTAKNLQILIVQVLATMLWTYVQKPSSRDCEIVAKSLVCKYPFLKEHVSCSQEVLSCFNPFTGKGAF